MQAEFVSPSIIYFDSLLKSIVGHFSSDCTTPEVCHNCEEPGHKAAECDKPRNPANATCRNCDEKGHFSRDCSKPRDWSRFECSICHQSRVLRSPTKNVPLLTV